MFAALQSSFILEKATGTSSETTFPSSSFKMQSNFQISFTLGSLNRIQKFLKHKLHIIISGIFKDSPPKLPIFLCGLCLTGIYLNICFNIGGFHEVTE